MNKHLILKEIFETYGFIDTEVATVDIISPKLKKIMDKLGIKNGRYKKRNNSQNHKILGKPL